MNKEDIQRAKTFFEQDYHDRGKIKWNGFFLSDHTQKINQNKEDRTTLHEWLDETPVHEMQRVCQEAFVNYRSIILQLNSTTSDMTVPEPIHALIRSFNEEGLWIDKNYYPFELIRHLEVKI
ncbi:hypothetical protein [Fructobacillus cardui]|uniref:hypothetical protein n=1 Tax=Fructobacillus cardui TaxID=2893170 RepID=UPI00200A28A5|nr:hypothetical protein [Fructobacillus cardui]MCK8627028.1 hypothetical protein [Fructobacillus cardui]